MRIKSILFHCIGARIGLATLGCLFILAGCSSEEPVPIERSSSGLTMNGTHQTTIEGAPDIVSTTAPIDSNAALGGWSCAPLSLAKPNGFVIGSRNGRVFFFDTHDSLTHLIDLPDHGAVDQLLSDSSTLYVVEVNGVTSAFDFAGKVKWSVPGVGILTVPAILCGSMIVLPAPHTVVSLDVRTGKTSWSYSSLLSLCAASFSEKSKMIALGVTHNESNETDSILFFTTDGRSQGSFGLPNSQITSNIALDGEDGRTLIVGLLGEAVGARRQADVREFALLETRAPRLVWKHSVPFLVGSIATNVNAVFASGFRTVENELVSGITAFSIHDTTTLWQRRFTEPLVSPLASSKGNIYFTLNFESQAIVSSRGLFYTLSTTDGHTVSERPLSGATEGVLPAMPMPDVEGRFLVADRAKPVVYILDRSTMRRVF